LNLNPQHLHAWAENVSDPFVFAQKVIFVISGRGNITFEGLNGIIFGLPKLRVIIFNR
jgi:hypothetical protein